MNRVIRRNVYFISIVFFVLLIPQAALADFKAYASSQEVECQLVDNLIAMIPHGDGNPVTDAEIGPGGWRFSSSGRSFVTFAYTLNGGMDGYVVVAGRSKVVDCMSSEQFGRRA